MAVKYFPEPFKIKMVEPIKMTTREEREQIIKEANYNMFSLKSEDVYIDLLSDSGTNAMSMDQWSALMLGDEAYSGSKSFYKLESKAKEIFGYDFIQPVHQGRPAESFVLSSFVQEGQFAISNMFFPSTRSHVEFSGGRAIDCVVEEAKDVDSAAKFKGNMDVEHLENIILEKGSEKIALILMTITNNSAGGQPVSMKNMRDTADICKKYGIPLNIDGARYAENAFFIKRDEEECKDMSMKEINLQFFSYADSFTISGKKDTICNMGGLIGIKDSEKHAEVVHQIKSKCISYEGYITYGGLNGRDMEALVVGLEEGLDEEYMKYRVGQLEYVASRLDEAKIPYQKPVGGSAVYIDAKAILPSIPYYEFPAHALAVELYKESGIRSCEIGSMAAGVDPNTGEQRQALFEFTRVSVPRRVYTQAHLDVLVDSLIAIKEQAADIKHGYKVTWRPATLGHFLAHLAPIGED
ncbi:MAG: tryptophanase [Clostridiaceae bacterium]